MWLIELAAAVYLARVLWPPLRRRYGRWRADHPHLHYPVTVGNAIAVCGLAWAALWVVHMVLTALARP